MCSACKQWLLFVGPEKTGTSWIDKILRSAEGTCLPKSTKETYFFDRHFDRGLPWYAGQFPDPDELLVETAPSYFFADGVPKRILETLPNAQIVVTLRDPVKRAVSHYLNLRKYGLTDAGIGDAIERFPRIVDRSIYADRLKKWLRLFGEENVHVLFYEEVIGDTSRLLASVPQLEEIEPDLVTDPGRVNAASVARSSGLGRFGQRAARWLRRNGLHGPVNYGKRLGMKRILFSGGSAPRKKHLEAALAPWHPAFKKDREALTRIVGRRPPWRAG